MNRCLASGALAVLLLAPLHAAEFHVAVNGNDARKGTKSAPLRTIQRAADLAQPGDVITVRAGVYRECVNPPRGGTSDTKRIVYQAAPGEKVTITGSEPAKVWHKVDQDTWKLTLPNSYFGPFNPFAEKVYGDWFESRGRVHRRGCVYLNGAWLTEAPNLDTVRQPAGQTPRWFATVDGAAADAPDYLLNVAWFQPAGGEKIPAGQPAARSGTQNAACAEGGECVGWIKPGHWLRYDNVDFGKGTESIAIRAAAAAGTGGAIELRLDQVDGELLGTCAVTATGDWQQWQSFTAKIKQTEGKKNLCLVFKPTRPARAEKESASTVIYAQFPGVNPNEAQVEISVRPTVFSPEKTNIDYITVRGFDLRNAATQWAAPTAGQVGLVTAYWCKGWIIENNEISHSRCCGIALGKYSDQWDGQRGSTEGYYLTIDDALKKDGWTREKIGGHLVRNNHIHHCGQTGIVGSLGCAFSRVIGNEIHDINLQGLWGGAEMAGIKFHGALDVIISGNHIYRCGELGGVWLDWMAQGTQVTGNLFHDNTGWGGDLFCEVDHGPYLVANNLFLSTKAHLANSQGGAYVHNLICGSLEIVPDGRRTPYFKAHSTEMVGLHDCPVGDVRLYNNLLAGRGAFSAFNGASWPVAAAGNVFTKGSQSSKFDTDALVQPNFDAGVKLTQKTDGWYLEINADIQWAVEQQRKLITTELLGQAKIPDLPFENPDGTPLKLEADYFGKRRNTANPFPGPFEAMKDGKQEVKVWPR
ncbi:MAG: carbohydrate-binding protein [Kiritimatiellaeota bacterium]|nr:carbohydrate-binding protein [Kiritimatiellota bacterium]